MTTQSSKPHILIVDDDIRILKLLKQFLSQNGYLVSTATSSKEAEIYLNEFIFDLVMLDVMMPEVTGIEFARTIKENKIHVPIILLTALSEPEDKVRGLEAGADDYITKPFEAKELLLRTKKLIDLYGYNKKSSNIIKFGTRLYDLNKKNLYDNDEGTIIKLSSTEKKLLEILIEHQETILSRERLSNLMGGLNERSVDVQIVRLRSKIENDPKQPRFLQTIRNEGYVLYI
jgi:two-component system phosphate regulon response regulator OmpR